MKIESNRIMIIIIMQKMRKPRTSKVRCTSSERWL